MITHRHIMQATACVGHAGLGKVDPADGVRKCIVEECLLYRRAVTYGGDVNVAMTAEENTKFKLIVDNSRLVEAAHGRDSNEFKQAMEAFWAFEKLMDNRYMLGGCALAGHSEAEYKRYQEGQNWADS